MAAVAPRGSRMALTPEATANPAESPHRRLAAARWAATRELEQAVLVGTQGPAHADEWRQRKPCNQRALASST